jgi:1-deoxy-D-xylulose-5-phosphate reductoisomerase
VVGICNDVDVMEGAAKRQAVAVLGSTGSVGVSTLDVLRRNANGYRVAALAANSSVDALESQCIEFAPDYAAMSDPHAAQELRHRLAARKLNTQVLAGPEALEKIAADPEIPVVMAAIVGFAGVNSTIAAANQGKRILLANKESLVVAGDLLCDAVRRGGATILPVDSEHNAIFQCLPLSHQHGAPVRGDEQIHTLVLTASGGPFRSFSSDDMRGVTVQQAVAHPNWDMGPKISVDSATMMNKGLEVIEACFLFGVDESQIEVVVHPQSVVHSMVRFRDGSVLAQLGEPDMRTPIASALAWPARVDAGVDQLDFCALSGLEFHAPDPVRFPCLQLAREAINAGQGANVVLNAANELSVAMFLDEKIRFVDIAQVNAFVLQHCPSESPSNVADLQALDLTARRIAEDYIANGLKSVGLV